MQKDIQSSWFSVKVSGGDAFKKRLQEMQKSIEKSKSVDVGWDENAKYEDGKRIALVAYVQEFGNDENRYLNTPNGTPAPIPPRPFFRGLVVDKKASWGGEIATKLQESNFDSNKALNEVGKMVGEQLKDKIIGFNSPRNSELTIELKGFDCPLVDSGEMADTIGHWVDK